MEDSRHSAEGAPCAGGADAETSALTDLRHQFRNQIQTMTSLVGLFGDRVEPGPARAAFQDLRARLEATAVMHGDGFAEAGRLRCDLMLATLARRIAALYDPGGKLHLVVETASFTAPTKRAGTIAQLFAEMLIEFFRGGTAAAQSGRTVSAFAGGGAGDGFSLRIDGPPAASAGAADDIAALGRLILQSLADGLDGEVVRTAETGFSLAVTAAGDAHPRGLKS